MCFLCLETSPIAGFDSSVIQYFVFSLCDFVRHQCPLMYIDGLISFASTVIFLFTVDISG